MEYTQWVSDTKSDNPLLAVLILVVMEYTQWVLRCKDAKERQPLVLILVVMEYTQWEQWRRRRLTINGS